MGVTEMHYNYLEVYGLDDCFVYTTVEPTTAPCHIEGAEKFKVSLYYLFLKNNQHSNHAKLIQEGRHTLYEIDDYLVEALEALSWFRKKENESWMPQAVRDIINSYDFDLEEVLKLKATYDGADKEVEVIKPQAEWGVLSKRLTKTLRDKFLKMKLEGEEVDAKSFYEKACRSFRRGLKLAPWLKQLYELGYCQTEGGLFFADEGHLSLLHDEDNGVDSKHVDGTTGSVRAKMKELINNHDVTITDLKDFFKEHTELFERMKEKDPELYNRLVVKVLFT